jgi:hypothetical protein
MKKWMESPTDEMRMGVKRLLMKLSPGIFIVQSLIGIPQNLNLALGKKADLATDVAHLLL